MNCFVPIADTQVPVTLPSNSPHQANDDYLWIGLDVPPYLHGDCADAQESDAHEDERDGPTQRICEILRGVKPDEAEHGNDSGE